MHIRTIIPIFIVGAAVLALTSYERTSQASDEIANLRKRTGMNDDQIVAAIQTYHAFGELASIEGEKTPPDGETVRTMVSEAADILKTMPKHDYSTANLAVICLKLAKQEDIEAIENICRYWASNYYNQYCNSKEPSFTPVLEAVEELAKTDPELAKLIAPSK
jgi:hypothetical protein